ncbi:MAG TPA: efflux RND transporter periplasmic adaptor subunit [Chthoniobacter sp.]|jgi:Cu(I)/Ag(I) efflux system membrane fusion protein
MRYTPLIFTALGLVAGWGVNVAVHGDKVMPAPSSAPAPREILYYQSPMHPWIKSATPGKCTVCGMDLVPIYRGSAGTAQPADAVLLPPESVRTTGIQTAAVTRAALGRTLRAAGTFEADASWHAIISAPVEGRIDGLGLVHGNGKVTQRQPLANIFSRTLLGAAAEYKQALNHDEAAVAAAKRKLEQMGLVWEQIKSIPLRQDDDLDFGILSPRTGTVVKSYVSEGQYVRAGEKLFEITDATRLWFLFPAYDQDLPLLAVGEDVELEASTLPGEKFPARIASIGQAREESMNGVHVRVEIGDPNRRFQLHGNGTATVHLQAPEVLVVPRAAVLWPGNGPRVYVETAPGIFCRRLVKLGRAGDAGWEVLSGLREGEQVVTTAAVLIDGQAQLDTPTTAAAQ